MCPSSSKKTLFYLSILLPVIMYSCAGNKSESGDKPAIKLSMDYSSFSRKISIPQPTKEQAEKFNAAVKGYKKDLIKASGKTISGYTSGNREFLEEVIRPLLMPHMEKLQKMPKREMINTLTLFGHELFQIYFGKDFYRWGGDILDLDDPQSRIHRFDARYGLDCSGFSTLPYELAVYFGLLAPDDPAALFSSKGFEIYCTKNGAEDKGGLDGGGNNFRLDTRELAGLGKEVFRVEKGGVPTDEQVKLLRAGDLIGRNGHFGIIVEIDNKPFYLESGGWVLSKTGGNPYSAKEALAIFAKNGIVLVKRSLPD